MMGALLLIDLSKSVPRGADRRRTNVGRATVLLDDSLSSSISSVATRAITSPIIG
jgi:hypothetical protein